MSKIVDWTLKNAEKKSGVDREEEEGPRWSVTIDEMNAYFGLVIIQNNLLMAPRNDRYFIAEDGKWPFHTNFGKIFTRKRFREIQKYLHFVDPFVERPPPGSPGYDRLFIIRPLLQHLNEKFRALYRPGKNISVDESMIPFKGHLSWIQQMPQKPVKVGIKVFVVADSQTGYCWNFEIYVGKTGAQYDDVGDLGKTDQIVVGLVKELAHKGYTLYMDNFYTSVPLAIFLQAQGILCCGTMRANRKHYPAAKLSSNVRGMKRGESVWASHKGLLALMWKDRKPVFFLSSAHDASMAEPIPRKIKDKDGQYKEINVDVPVLVKDYNQGMGGVDKSDKQAIVKKDKKQKRFYMRIFVSMLMKTNNNAYILEGHFYPHKVPGKSKRDLLQFKEELSIQLIGNVRTNPNARGRKRQRETDISSCRLQNVGKHMPVKGKGKDHTCIVCRRKRKHWIENNPGHDPKDCPVSLSKTTFCCSGCDPPESIYLCM